MAEFGLGYKGADEPDERDGKFAIGTLGLGAPPASASIRGLVVDVLDQKTLNSCVANALMQAWRMVNKRKEGDVALCSRLFAYFNSRAQHGDTLNDSGTFIRLSVKQGNKLGFPVEAIWPYDVSKWAERPVLTAYQFASDVKLVSYHRVAGDGAERRDGIKRAIAGGMPVLFGTDVSESFLVFKGGASVGIPADDIVGGHAMVIVGYDERGVFVVNSWGDWWGDAGFVHMTWEYIEWFRTRDIWAIG